MTITKDACTIVGSGATQKQVEARVKQIRNMAAAAEQEYEKEKLNERIARLSGGVAIIQVHACMGGGGEGGAHSHGPRCCGALYHCFACAVSR